MDPARRMGALIAPVGGQSLMAEPGPRVPVQSHLDPGAVACAVQVVYAYLTNLDPPRAARTGDLAVKRSALGLVAAARQAMEDAQAIELAAAVVARYHGGTVRELSDAAEISERAATTRYRRTSMLEQALADTLLALGDHERILPDLRVAARGTASVRADDGQAHRFTPDTEGASR
jgi:hypothetical protein